MFALESDKVDGLGWQSSRFLGICVWRLRKHLAEQVNQYRTETGEWQVLDEGWPSKAATEGDLQVRESHSLFHSLFHSLSSLLFYAFCVLGWATRDLCSAVSKTSSSCRIEPRTWARVRTVELGARRWSLIGFQLDAVAT